MAIRLGEGTELAQRFFPWAHVTLSNLKLFLLGTHHKPQAKHMARYVAEFAYQLNRRWQEASLFERLGHACLRTETMSIANAAAKR